MNLTSTAKKILAAAVAALLILSFMPMTQENAYAAKAKKPAKVTGVKITVSKANKVTVTWKKAKNAKKYNVSIKDGSTKFTSVKSVKGLKLSFKGGNAVKYTVKVQGVNGKVKGSFSKAASKKTNDLLKAAQDALDKANEEKEKAEAALKEEQESADDGNRVNQNDESMHVVYSTSGMLRINDEGSSVTLSEDGQTATVVAKTSKSKTWGKITKLAFTKQTATDEEKDAAAADIVFDDDTFYEDKSVQRTLTFSIPASKIGKKIPVCRYQYKKNEETNEFESSWLDFENQAYMIVLTENERQLYQELAEAKARAEAAEKALADIRAANAVVEAWAEVPEIDVDSDEDDIAEVQAVIAAYDELTDDQKALIPDDVKAEIEAAKAVIAEIEEAKAKIEAVKKAIKDATPANYPTDTNTIEIEGEEYCVMAVDDEAKEAKLVKKMPVLDGEDGIPFDVNGGYNWEDSSLRSFMNDKENGFFKGRELLYSMSLEKDFSYSITYTTWDSGDPEIISCDEHTTKDRAVLMDKPTFNSVKTQWADAWDDQTISTWVYETTKGYFDEDEEDFLGGFVLMSGGQMESQHLTHAWIKGYKYYEGVSNNAEPSVNGVTRKIGICPVVYVSIA